MVLLKNQGNILPIQKVKKIAVIGSNAKGTVISGGGSAFLKASYIVNPWQGITSGAPEDAEVIYSVGCYGNSPSNFCHDSSAHLYLTHLSAPLPTNSRGPPSHRIRRTWMDLRLLHPRRKRRSRQGSRPVHFDRHRRRIERLLAERSHYELVNASHRDVHNRPHSAVRVWSNCCGSGEVVR